MRRANAPKVGGTRPTWANAGQLLRMRGRGWLVNYLVGNVAPDRGLPLANAFRWDTGVQVQAASDGVG